MKRNCIAMILAGGGGTRLKPLTKKLAKPAVLFGGKYRIIDFAISNCINSGIDVMGILVQYEPLILNSYISSGSANWNNDRHRSTVTILPPHMHENGGCWYKGTANAIYQNMEFIDMYEPDYVLILSADQVYKMDYAKMLEFHIQSHADITVASTRVPLAEAIRFGILNTDADGKINEFEEKPAFPKSNLASMGIYIYNSDVLKDVLYNDEQDQNSSNDFGRDILPGLVTEKKRRIYAYEFSGYWQDVGTIRSFWDAHMDLLDENNTLNLHDPSWKIYSENPTYPPLYINHTARVNASLIGDGCYIQGEVYNSVLFPGVFIGRGARIFDSVIMSNARIEENSVVKRAIVGSQSIVRAHSKVYCPINSDDIIYIDEADIVQ
jgi:glucose-1-phosphate adenylyltransferase